MDYYQGQALGLNKNNLESKFKNLAKGNAPARENEKLSEKDRNSIIKYRFPEFIHQYLVALRDVIQVANFRYSQPLKPESIYLDRFGQVSHQWMIDPVVVYYKEAIQEGDKRPISVDEFIKLSLTINSHDFEKKHGREMTKQERDLAKQAIKVSK
jgi:hypothetical protein